MKTVEELKQFLCDSGYEDAVVFDGPEYLDAFIGVSDEGRAVYSYDKMVESLMIRDDMTMMKPWSSLTIIR